MAAALLSVLRNVECLAGGLAYPAPAAYVLIPQVSRRTAYIDPFLWREFTSKNKFTLKQKYTAFLIRTIKNSEDSRLRDFIQVLMSVNILYTYTFTSVSQ